MDEPEIKGFIASAKMKLLRKAKKKGAFDLSPEDESKIKHAAVSTY